LISSLSARFRSASVSEPETSARLIVEAVTGRSRSQDVLDDTQIKHVENMALCRYFYDQKINPRRMQIIDYCNSAMLFFLLDIFICIVYFLSIYISLSVFNFRPSLPTPDRAWQI
jgi:hypothetical protein